MFSMEKFLARNFHSRLLNFMLQNGASTNRIRFDYKHDTSLEVNCKALER
jgi:hypothetical protein